MAELNVIYPNDSIVIVQDLTTLDGGRTLDVTGNVNDVIVAGSIVVDNSGTLEVLQSCIAETAQASGDSSVQIYKGHGIKIGDLIKGVTVTAIDTTTSDVYDIASGTGTFGAAVGLDESIVTNGADAIGVVMTSKSIKDDDTVDVGVLYRGEVNEAAMTAPVDAAVKTALPLIYFS